MRLRHWEKPVARLTPDQSTRAECVPQGLLL